jgi:hypothetical protein
MGFFMFGKGRSSLQDEKVVEITSKGKSALMGQTVSGLEAEILEQMKSGHPYTLDTLCDRLPSQSRSFIRISVNHLLGKRYLEIAND